MIEGLTWGGIDMGSLALRARDLSGLLTISGRRGENIPVSGRDGAVRVPRKKYDGKEFVVEYLVRGVLPDGTVPPAGQNVAFYRNIDTLAALCVQDVAPMVHTLPDGTRRTLDVEVLNEVNPSRYRAGMLGEVKIAYTAAAAFWRGLSVININASLANGATRVLTELAGGSGRIDDALVTFRQGTNPVIRQVETGVWLAYDEAIGAGRSIRLGDYAAVTTGGLVFDRRKLRHDPRNGPWWVIDPVPGGAPTIRLDHNGTGTMNIEIAARQSWAVG